MRENVVTECWRVLCSHSYWFYKWWKLIHKKWWTDNLCVCIAQKSIYYASSAFPQVCVKVSSVMKVLTSVQSGGLQLDSKQRRPDICWSLMVTHQGGAQVPHGPVQHDWLAWPYGFTSFASTVSLNHIQETQDTVIIFENLSRRNNNRVREMIAQELGKKWGWTRQER